MNLTDDSDDTPLRDPNYYYISIEIVITVLCVLTNLVVIAIIKSDDKLKTRTNSLILWLAYADFLIGIYGVPFAILVSIGYPRNHYWCIKTISAFTSIFVISNFFMVAISIDRFWAIHFPVSYRNCSGAAIKTGILCWILGLAIGFLPVLGWHTPYEGVQCYFTRKMAHSFLTFKFVLAAVVPNILLLIFYGAIYIRIMQMNREHTKKIVNNTRSLSANGVTNLNATDVAHDQFAQIRKREIKITINLSLVIGVFMICKLPLNTINFLDQFCSDCLTLAMVQNSVALAHATAFINPILFAYCNKNFRRSFLRMIGRKNVDPGSSTGATRSRT